jgi:hypothetical protein
VFYLPIGLAIDKLSGFFCNLVFGEFLWHTFVFIDRTKRHHTYSLINIYMPLVYPLNRREQDATLKDEKAVF